MHDHELNLVLRAARACTLCGDILPLGPRPILQASASSRVLIIGQAPGTKAHESGRPWNDQSGRRLREWTGLTDDQFYDETKIAIIPAGLCYPGAVPGGGDKSPVPACAPLWHKQILPLLTDVRLTLLVGLHAQKLYLKSNQSLTELVHQHPETSCMLPLPHPSWRVAGWMRKNAWFELEKLPMLRRRVAEALS